MTPQFTARTHPTITCVVRGYQKLRVTSTTPRTKHSQIMETFVPRESSHLLVSCVLARSAMKVVIIVKGMFTFIVGKGGAPPPPPGGMPPPPPVLPDVDFSNLSVDDRSALFAEINQGEGITSSKYLLIVACRS